MKVRVIYDFVAQWSGELTVCTGEELTITNQNVGSGWWQAVNAFGKEGLIPSEFVEIIELPEPPVPPPPLPATEFGKEIDRCDEWDDEWDSDENDIPSSYVDDSFQWRHLSRDLTSCISSFRKDSKMKGIKSFIAYQITNSVGRYEDDFVDERRKWLQQWLTRMCKHPVVSHSSVFIHFLTCTDFKIICVILHICSLDLLFPSSFSLSVCIGIRKEFSKLSMAFLNMSKAIESDVHTSTIEFTRLLPNTSTIISLAKAACLTVDELNRCNADEQKVCQSDVNRIQSGALLITRSVQSECNLIMSQIRDEWMNKIKDYLYDQARFYHQIAEQIERAAQSFEID
ncbi:sorting nexin-9/18/33 [Schistosoma bovis]|uniref:Sorting nexin-9/18/33 n=1 Tax=Schistosoma bovis TaxID=6184 RepID=A0A430Q3H1_SCHBO|nr:sorting nexin-9/18/33 [Schistosoma bovis]